MTLCSSSCLLSSAQPPYDIDGGPHEELQDKNGQKAFPTEYFTHFIYLMEIDATYSHDTVWKYIHFLKGNIVVAKTLRFSPCRSTSWPSLEHLKKAAVTKTGIYFVISIQRERNQHCIFSPLHLSAKASASSATTASTSSTVWAPPKPASRSWNGEGGESYFSTFREKSFLVFPR